YSSVIAILRDFQRGGARQVNPMRVPFATSNCAPSWWMIRRGITGYNGNIGSGECSGLDAILLAIMQIRRGRIDAAIAGGVESQTPELWDGLRRMQRVRGPISEAVGTLALSCDAEGAWARCAGWAAAFERKAPDTALERAAKIALKRAGRERVDLAVTPHVGGHGLPATASVARLPFLGETLGAGSALAALVGALHMARGDSAPTSVLVGARSAEGYASALVMEAV
ncbi:MAG: beta-ketoacyl synthase N-terminal-like domain-containing protein, partial [Myxococcota bacterium]